MAEKILLIYPCFPTLLKNNIPLNLLHLGSYIKSFGYDVKLIDCNVEDDYLKLVADHAHGSLCIGISCMTNQIPDAMKISQHIKKSLKCKAPIVFGGVHPTLYPAQTLKETFIDYLIAGEGEASFLKLIKVLSAGAEKQFTDIPGLGYIDKDGKIVIQPPGETIDFSEFPSIDYSILNHKVIARMQMNRDYFPLITSRGCPYKCAFCINVITRNIKWRAWKAERTLKEMERIVSMGFDNIWIWDDNFFTNKGRVVQLLELLEEKSIKINAWAEGRVNYIRENFLNQELLQRLKKNGFNRIGFGFESGSQRMLDYLDKEITIEEIIHAASQCSQAGIRVSASFMIGLPTETDEDIHQTVQLIGKISEIATLFGISGPILYRPYPGSKLYDDVLACGWEEPADFFEWRVFIYRFLKENLIPQKHPWIKNPLLVDVVHFYSFTLPVTYKNIYLMFKEFCRMYKKNRCFFLAGTPSLLALSFFGKTRYKLNFFSFFFEKKIFAKYHPNQSY